MVIHFVTLQFIMTPTHTVIEFTTSEMSLQSRNSIYDVIIQFTASQLNL